MTITGNNFYKLSSAFFITGYVWLFYNFTSSGNAHGGICIFKWLTHLPCPSCGTTRAVGLLMEGDISSSIALNPFGILCFTAMLIYPFWLLYDWWQGKQTMLSWYGKMEQRMSSKPYSLLLFTLIALNWFWNIYKGL